MKRLVGTDLVMENYQSLQLQEEDMWNRVILKLWDRLNHGTGSLVGHAAS